MTERFVDTSSLAGIERASSSGWEPQENVDTTSLRGVQRATNYRGFNLTYLRPEEDFSFTGMQQRLREERAVVQARLDNAASDAAYLKEYGATPSNLSNAYDEVRSAYFAMLMSYNGRQASNLTKYPQLAAAALEANVDERDVARLVNYAEADKGAEQLLAAFSMAGQDPRLEPERDRIIRNVMGTADPVMQLAIWDVFTAKIEELATGDGEVEEDLSWLDVVKAGIAGGLNALFTPLTFLNENAQRVLRAYQYGAGVEETPGVPLVGYFQNIFEYWDQVEAGNYDQKLLTAARNEYGTLTVDLLLEVEQLARDGDADPIVTLLDKYSDDPERMAIIRPMLYREAGTADVQAAARAVDQSHLGNTGQVVLSSILGETALGSADRDFAAGVTNVVATIALDPTIIGSKVRSAYLAAKYAISAIAPGASRAGVRAALGTRQTRRYFDSMFRDLDRYDELLKTDPARASMLRERIRRQYQEVPDDLIDELRTAGVRNTDELADWVIETNAMFMMANGQAARELVYSGPAAFREGSFASNIVQRGSALNRNPMLPRMTPGRVARMKFSRAFGAVAAPTRRGREAIALGYNNTDDVDAIIAATTDPASAMQIGAIERGGLLTPGAYGKRVDSFFKYFSSLPNKGYVSIEDARDARVFYRWARSFLTRQQAVYLTDAFRRANPGQRYNMIVGLNRTSAAAKGLDLMDESVLARVDELVKPTSSGTKFAASVRQPVDESSITVVVNGNTRKIQFADDFVPPMQTSLSAESVQVIERVEIGGMVDTARLIARVSLNKDAKSHNIWVRELTKFRKNQDPDFNQFGPIDDATLRETEKIADEIMGEWYARTQQILVDRGYPEYVRVWRTADPSFGDPAKGLVSVTLHSRPVDTLGGDAYEYLIPRSRILYDNQGMVGQRIPDKALPGGTPFVEREMEAFVRIEDLKRLDPNAKPTPVARGGRDLQTPEPLDVVVQPTTQATDNYINPSNFNGVEKALFGWQTATHVAIPSMRDMELLAKWRGVVPEWFQNLPQSSTDLWSLGTLFGWRFAMRSAIEDLWFYAVITGGNIGDLYSARRVSTAIREATGRKRERALGKPPGQEQQALGAVNRRARSLGDWLESRDGYLAQSFSRFIRGNLDQDEVARAHEAARKGDYAPMRNLVGVALTRARLTGINEADMAYVEDLVSGPFGLKILDDLAETGRTINSGGFANDALPPAGTDAPGVGLVAVPREGTVRGPTGEFFDLPLDGTRPEAFLYWERAINGAILGDWDAGRIAVAWLDDVEEATRRVADEIRLDPKQVGYSWRFGALQDVTVDEFARRKVTALRSLFSDANGNFNEKLWRRVVDENRNVVAFDVAEDGERVFRISANSLRGVPRDQRPEFVAGQAFEAIPTANGLEAFTDRSWGWMGEQYARISREPVFIANYLSQRRALADMERTLAGQIGEKAARRHVSRIAEDRAYHFTLSYMDNPQNRSILAWKVRNVSRYYRATEDFYRRVARAGKNYPVGLWKTALIYDVLDDTGFVYEDDNGDKYFMYPGSQYLMAGLNRAMQIIGGVEPLDMSYPFVLGGKVNMLAPSTDPNQMFPTIAGPFAAVSWKLMAARFPALAKMNQYVLGEYGASAATTVPGILSESLLPAGILKVMAVMDEDERDSMFAAAQKDAMAIAVANDLVPEDRNDPGWADAVAAVNVMAVASVITRFGMGLMVPASPQRYNDNITEYARTQGSVDMRNAFLDLVQKKGDAGSENPVGEALVDWFRLNPGLFPFTVSKTEKNPALEGKIMGLSPLKYSQKVSEWWDDNADLRRKYPQAAFFLAPQDEGFSWDTWMLVKAEGFRVSKDLDTFMRDVFAAQGEFHYYATIADYQRDIDALDPRIPEQYSQIRELQEQLAADKKFIRAQNPFLDEKLDSRNFRAISGAAKDALPVVKQMVDELYDTTPKEEWEGSAAQAIRNSILTYLDYKTELDMITGTTAEENQRKRVLQFGMEKDLEFLGEQNANARLFIRNVLMREPELVGLASPYVTGGD